MNKTPHITHGQREDREIIDFDIRNERRAPGKVKEYEPEVDVDLEIVEIGETNPTIEQERRRGRIGKIIGDIGDTDDYVDNQIEWPSWSPDTEKGA